MKTNRPASAANRALRIGISVNLMPNDSLWVNGIKQNAVYLCECLRHCPNVGDVFLVNFSDTPPSAALWDAQRWKTVHFNAVKDRLDIMIELGVKVPDNAVEYLKQRNVKLVSYCCGFEYIHMMENIMFGKNVHNGQLSINQRYDDIWMIPQVEHNSRGFFEVFRRRRARVIPFVWSPVFVERQSAALPNRGLWRPRTDGTKWRLTVMEPNINVVKFCLYPILIAETAYRRQPEKIDMLHVCNAIQFAQHSPDFVALMHHLDLVQDNKATFIGRYNTPDFLAAHTDIVISHQWDNPLNYFYFDVCWQGYPLVHNADMVDDLGYFYPENDVERGAEAVLHAMRRHAAEADDYLAEQRRKIARFFPDNAENVRIYTSLLDTVHAQTTVL